jgi:hypothetical protein
MRSPSSHDSTAAMLSEVVKVVESRDRVVPKRRMSFSNDSDAHLRRKTRRMSTGRESWANDRHETSAPQKHTAAATETPPIRHLPRKTCISVSRVGIVDGVSGERARILN